MDTTLSRKLTDIYDRLLRRYGPQRWWPGDSAFEVIIGAILTQSAAWTNVDKALDNLKANGLMEPTTLRAIPLEELAALIRPSVYFNAKARKLKAFVEHLGDHYDDDLEAMFRRDLQDLRPELLAIYGIGEETADDILLYAANKPVFVMDAYTRRILDRLQINPARTATPPTRPCSWTTSLMTPSCSTSTTLYWTVTAWSRVESESLCAASAACWTCAPRAR